MASHRYSLCTSIWKGVVTGLRDAAGTIGLIGCSISEYSYTLRKSDGKSADLPTASDHTKLTCEERAVVSVELREVFVPSFVGGKYRRPCPPPPTTLWERQKNVPTSIPVR